MYVNVCLGFICETYMFHIESIRIAFLSYVEWGLCWLVFALLYEYYTVEIEIFDKLISLIIFIIISEYKEREREGNGKSIINSKTMVNPAFDFSFKGFHVKSCKTIELEWSFIWLQFQIERSSRNSKLSYFSVKPYKSVAFQFHFIRITRFMMIFCE